MSAEAAFIETMPTTPETETTARQASEVLLKEVIDTEAVTQASLGEAALAQVPEPGWQYVPQQGLRKEDNGQVFEWQTGQDGGAIQIS